jgi:hypothetical protein
MSCYFVLTLRENFRIKFSKLSSNNSAVQAAVIKKLTNPGYLSFRSYVQPALTECLSLFILSLPQDCLYGTGSLSFGIQPDTFTAVGHVSHQVTAEPSPSGVHFSRQDTAGNITDTTAFHFLVNLRSLHWN